MLDASVSRTYLKSNSGKFAGHIFEQILVDLVLDYGPKFENWFLVRSV